MKIKAAVLREPKKPYTIEELELAPPQAGEVLIRYASQDTVILTFTSSSARFPLPYPLWQVMSARVSWRM